MLKILGLCIFLLPLYLYELFSTKIISGVTSFLVKLNKSFTKFDKFCTSDKEYNIEAITAIGEMMTDLADLFAVLGGITDAEEIRKQGDFTKTVVVSKAAVVLFCILKLYYPGKH